jgi:hypothetical protein
MLFLIPPIGCIMGKKVADFIKRDVYFANLYGGSDISAD